MTTIDTLLTPTRPLEVYVRKLARWNRAGAIRQARAISLAQTILQFPTPAACLSELQHVAGLSPAQLEAAVDDLAALGSITVAPCDEPGGVTVAATAALRAWATIGGAS